MRLKLEGDWKTWVFLGLILLVALLLLGTVISATFGIFIWVLKGLGAVLIGFLKFVFASAYRFVGVVLLAYIAYRSYIYFQSSEEKIDSNSINYSDEDFER